MEKLNELLHKHQWELLCYKDIHGSGTWALLAQDTDLLRSLERASNLCLSSANAYRTCILTICSWLPAGYGDTLPQALDQLEKKLQLIPDGHIEIWKDDVLETQFLIAEYLSRGDGHRLIMEIDGDSNRFLPVNELWDYASKVRQFHGSCPDGDK